MLITFVTIVHVIVSLMLVGVVLLQQGKGADMGAAFGGGSQTLFGASGADNLLTRVTTGAAGIFMITSIVLAINSNRAIVDDSSLFKGVEESAPAAAPAAPPSNEAVKTESTSAEQAAPTADATATAAPAAANADAAPVAAPETAPSATTAAAPETAPGGEATSQ